MLLRKFIPLIFLIFFTSFAFSQTQVNPINDPNPKLVLAHELYNKAEELFNNGDFEEAILISNHAINACEEVGMLQGVSQLLLNLGVIHRIYGEYSKSLRYLYSSLENFETLGNYGGQASALNEIGSIYRLQGNYPGALEYFLKSLTLYTQVDGSLGRASALNNIGIVYFYQNNFPKALEYYLASLEIELALNQEYGVSVSYINIGEVHKKMGNYQQALDFFLRALVLAKKYEEHDKDGDSIGILYNEIGSIYLEINEFTLSLSYLEKALAIFQQLNNQQRLAECKIYLGGLSLKLGKKRESLILFKEALVHAQSISAVDLIAQANKNISSLYESFGDTGKAFIHYKQYIDARDSIFNEDNMKRMVQTEMLYEFDKQMTEARIEQAKRDVKVQELASRQKIFRNSLILIIIMSFIVVGLIYGAYRNKKNANIKLASQQEEIIEKNEELLQQQEEIVSQRDEIESKNKILMSSQQIIEAKNERIISSIEYALTIQQAILPNKEQLSNFLPEHVVLFLPKDIVSGDFYWFSAIDNILFVAVIDCTGHGVPGAFMSVIGNTMLNQIVNEWQTRSPALILEIMHKQVRKALKQDESDSKGHVSMDICLVSIDLSNKLVTFAGASRPIYVVQNNRVEKIMGDPRSIGGYQREDSRYFTNHNITLDQPTTLYLTTDGYIDQMNSEYKKFGQRQFSKLLLDIYDKPVEIQHKLLLSTLERHQMEQDQIDDICILGLRV
jgi:serine phosphatase RsbU (regulator of sigma subunit)